MEWVKRLRDKVVGLDTAPLIYFIEDHPTYAQRLTAFFEDVDHGRIRVVTSVVTLTEVLVLYGPSGKAGMSWSNGIETSYWARRASTRYRSRLRSANGQPI